MKTTSGNWFVRMDIFAVGLVLLLFFLSPKVLAAPSTYVSRGNTNEKVVALTIDDGSDGTNFNRILDILDKHNVTATFFLTGSGAQEHPQAVRNAVNQGHEIGNHSYNHPDFTTISTAAMNNQMQQTETIIKNITGQTTKPYFRAPYGATNHTVLNTVGNAGYTYTFHWTIDTLDWTGNSATTIRNRVVNNIVPGAIVLMHTGAGASGTPAALDSLIPILKNQGYRFVTVSDLLRPVSLPTSGRYTVRAGDTLYGIALRFNTTVAQISVANNIANPSLIRVGQILTIPSTGGSTPTNPPTTLQYTVRAGDTLSAIATRHNRTVTQIARANNMSNVNLIRVGQVLTIPTTGGTTTPPPVKTYTVQAGDTLYRIAINNNTTVARLVANNRISNPNALAIGQVLIINMS